MILHNFNYYIRCHIISSKLKLSLADIACTSYYGSSSSSTSSSSNTNTYILLLSVVAIVICLTQPYTNILYTTPQYTLTSLKQAVSASAPQTYALLLQVV